MVRSTLSALFVLTLGSGAAFAAPITVGGILFPGGPESFVDAVVSYSPGGGVGVNGPQVFNDPQAIIGLPDYNGSTGAVSLGDANLPSPNLAELIVRFVDNSLTTSGTTTPDLHIFEVGTDVEPFLLAISVDGMTWLNLGSFQGQPASIDIDAFPGVVQGAKYSFLRFRDDPTVTSPFNRTFAEADFDAIGAISSAAPAAVPEPASLALAAVALLGMHARRGRRRLP
jgi:hypothetical protein